MNPTRPARPSSRPPRAPVALESAHRIGLRIGTLELGEVVDIGVLGPVHALVGSHEVMLVFDGPSIDPDADFDNWLGEIERLHEADSERIQRITAAGEAMNQRFCVFDLVDEPLLSDVLATRGPLPLGSALMVLHELAAALAEAHAVGVAHGGLTPDTLWLHGGAEPYAVTVGEFAVVRLRTIDHGHPCGRFAAPSADPRTPTAADDLYALGVIAFELLTGCQHPKMPVSIGEVITDLPPALVSDIDALRGLVPARRPAAAAVASTFEVVDLPLARLEATPEVAGLQVRIDASQPATPPPPAPPRNRPLYGLIVALGVVLSLATWLAMRPAEAPEPSGQRGLERRMADIPLPPGARRLVVGDDHPTLIAAVNAAQPHDQVVVPLGRHEGPVRIRRPITLIAEQGAVLEATDRNALVIEADARITGLTVASHGAANRYTVRVSAGQVRLEDVIVRGGGGSALGVTGRASVTLRAALVQGGTGSGILALDRAQVELDLSTVEGASISGLELGADARAVLHQSRLHDNAGAGVLARDRAQLTVEAGEFNGNGNAGIVARGQAVVRILGAQVVGNQAAGIFLKSAGDTLVEGCTVQSNRYAGIEIRAGARPVIRRNTLQDGQAGGILVHDDARPVIEDNRVERHRMAGVEIASRAEPVLRRNQIIDSLGVGLLVHQGARGLLEANLIRGSQGLQVRIDGAAPRLVDNRIEQGRSDGVGVRGGATPTLEGNIIRANAGVGLLVADARPIATANRVERNGGAGVVVEAGGGGTFTANRLTHNGAGAWAVATPGPNLVRRDNVVEPAP